MSETEQMFSTFIFAEGTFALNFKSHRNPAFKKKKFLFLLRKYVRMISKLYSRLNLLKAQALAQFGKSPYIWPDFPLLLGDFVLCRLNLRLSSIVTIKI